MDSICPSTPQKQCTKCPNSYPATPEFFHREKSHKDGLRSDCKECSNKRVKQHYKEHPEYYKQYAQEHVEEYCQNARNYKKRHSDFINTLNRNRWINQKRAVAGTYTAQQIQEQLKRQHYKCYYAACGFAKFKKVKGKYVYHIDHTFPLSRIAGMDIPGNSIDYLVLTCPTCNMSKNNKFPHEWPEGGRLL